MSERVIEWLVKILLPLGAIALIIAALVDPIKGLVTFVLALVILRGIWSIVDPESAFMFGQRWQFRRAEPSEAALLWTKIGGVITVVLSIIVLLILLLR